MDKKKMENWINKIKEQYKNGKLIVNMYFMYREEKKRNINKILLCDFEKDPDIVKSMIDRLSFMYRHSHLETYEWKKFNLIESNDKTYYVCSEDQFTNLKLGLKVITHNKVEHDTFDIKDLSYTYGILVQLNDVDNKNISYAFINIGTFNSLRMKKMSTAFIASVKNITSGNITRHEVKALDDSHLIFGINNKIDFIYTENEFIINPKGKAMFETLFVLDAEYKRRASETADKLRQFNNVLRDIDSLKGDIDSRNIPLADKMLTKIGDPVYFKKLNSLLTNQKNFSNRLMEVEKFKQDPNYKNDFKNLKIDVKKGTMSYTDKSIYQFISVLSDRPVETILLKRKILGNM